MGSQDLESALQAGDVAAARALLATGSVDLNKRRRGCAPPMQYVIYGNVPLAFAKELVAAGYGLEVRHGGYAALHRAVWADSADRVRELIRLGADPNAPDEFRRSPLALAASHGKLLALDALLRTTRVTDDIAGAIRVAEKQLALGTKHATAIQAAIARLSA